VKDSFYKHGGTALYMLGMGETLVELKQKKGNAELIQ